MFTLILIFIGLVGLAVVAYAVIQAATLNCPHCVHQEQQGLLWPVIPGVKFWCSNCAETCSLEQAKRTLQYEDEPEVVDDGYGYDDGTYGYEAEAEPTSGYAPRFGSGYVYEDDEDDD